MISNNQQSNRVIHTLFFFFLGCILAQCFAVQVDAATIFSQSDASTQFTTGTNESIWIYNAFTLSATTTVGDVYFYCGLDPYARGGDQCVFQLVDTTGGTTSPISYTVNPLQLTPQLYSTTTIDVPLSPGNYDILFASNTSGNSIYTFGTALNVPWVYLGTGGDDPTLTTSNITSVVPGPDSVVATSTAVTFAVNGNLTDDDYSGNNGQVSIYVRWQQKTGAGIRGNPDTLENGSFTFPLTAGGAFAVSTTTSVLNSGDYYGYAQIQVPYFTIFGINIGSHAIGNTVLWRFTAGTSSAIEQGQSILGLSGFAQASTTAALPSDADTCFTITNFNAVDCFSFLFTPDPLAVAQIETEGSTLLQKAPWGYATRAIALLTGQATSSQETAVSTALPSLNINIGQAIPVAASGESFDLTPWQDLMGPTSILSTATSSSDGKTFRDIVEPGWDFLIAFLFGMAMLSRIIGLDATAGVNPAKSNARRASYDRGNRSRPY